jgi:DNA-binding CsgD family transcriptional regulator
MTGALIGRHSQLEQIIDAFKDSRAGRATTVVIRGEPGIGKSRLLAEGLAQAEQLGHVVLHARLEDLDRYLPYAAIRAALLPALTGERDHELSDVAWTVREALEAARTGSSDEPIPIHRLTAGLEELLRAWAERDPLVLAVDDLHAADADTLTVLALLIRQLRSDRISFVMTTRAHPPDVSAALAALIERLGRDGLADVLDLEPLDRHGVRALATAVLDAGPDDGLVHMLCEETKGNPFYVGEGLRSLIASGALVLEEGRCRLSFEAAGAVSLRAPSAIIHRLSELGPAANSAARALTAFGRFSLDDLPLLASLSGLDAEELEDAFDTLVKAHVLDRTQEGYEFAHPIVRHTLYDDLGPAERRRAHATIAAHLAAARGEGRDVSLADLATHVAASAGAGDEAAVAVLVEAAEAMAATAPASAAAWYEKAFDLAPAADARRAELRADQAKALFLASQLERAENAANLALNGLEPGSLRSRTAALEVSILTALGRFDQALESSDALARESSEPAPRLLAERGALLVYLDRLDEAAGDAERALALAGGDDGARAMAYRTRSIIDHARGDVAAFRERFDLQMRSAERLGPAARLSALATHAMHLSLFGFLHEATRAIADAEDLRDALGGAALRGVLDVASVVVDWQAGRWDLALERARWVALPPNSREAWGVLARCAQLAIEVARGNAAAAKRLAAELGTAPMAASTARWAEARFLQFAGAHDDAAAILEKAWHHNEECGRLADAHMLLGDLVDLEQSRGNTEAASRWAAVMAEALAETAAPAALVVRGRCVAATTGDVGAGRRALAEAQQHGLVVEGAGTGLALGLLGDDPATNLRAAYETYRALGAESLRRRAAQAMRSAGVEIPRRRRKRGAELTETEIKLSQLVHDGLTNREIASVLIVSPKTVEVYLSRLFAKTGCASRVELAVAVSEGRIPLAPG